MSTELINVTTVSCQEFKCSARGLILPFGIEACISIQLRAVFYFIFLLYLFLGIAIITSTFMSSLETITSRRRKIHFPDPEDKDKFLTIEVRVWNDAVANFSAPQILLPVIEIIANRFEAEELGPGTIVGSAAYNLLITCALCILAIDSPDAKRIKVYRVFMVTFLFGFFAYIWMFIVLSLISKDVVELWEAVLTFLMFPWVVILAFLTEKWFFASKRIDMEEEEQTLISKSLGRDTTGSPLGSRKNELIQFLRVLSQTRNLSLEDKSQIYAAKLSETKHRSRMEYRIEGVRMLTGGKSLFINLPNKLREIYTEVNKRDPTVDHRLSVGTRTSENDNYIDDNEHKALIEFSTTTYAVLEREQQVVVKVRRRNLIDVDVRFRLDTIDGTATAGEDYIKLSEEFKMERGQQEKQIIVHIIDDNQWESDETFFVKLSLPEDEETHAKLGSKIVALVTIINDPEPGVIEFEEPIALFKASVGKVELKLLRINGADGHVSVHYKTKDDESVQNEVIFEHGEISKIISIPIIDNLETEEDDNFVVELYNPTGGAQLGKHTRTVVTIISDDDYKIMANKLASLVRVNMDKLSVTKISWGEQFHNAMNVNGGDLETATVGHYIGHALSFFWKVLFSFVPPTTIAGGWLTFFVSLILIAILTAVVADIAAIFGCLVGLKDSITAITLVAVGTSLPDTFASMIAAKKSKTADDAIENVTGSNSVNVFLGLGLPWLIATIYWESKNLPFIVKAGDLSFSVLVFSICCVFCMFILILRRYLNIFGKAELGGPKIPKYLCSIFLFLLWISYLLLSVLHAYGHIKSHS